MQADNQNIWGEIIRMIINIEEQMNVIPIKLTVCDNINAIRTWQVMAKTITCKKFAIKVGQRDQSVFHAY